MGEMERIREYLSNSLSEAYRDPLWKHIYLSNGMVKICQSKDFMRLSRIRQLGPAYLIYPGAVHTRYSHSLGVFTIACQILSLFVRKSSTLAFSFEGCVSFLLAALLHDLGHFPYTHSLKELPLEEHEALTAQILLTEPIRDLIRDEGANPELVAAIIDKSRPISWEGGFFRSILSGVLDPDKLDYLSRDAFHCGVPYGMQDLDFILSRIEADPERGIVIDQKGILAVEHLLFSKYLMYSSVYWHRDIRAATSMMKKALYLALDGGSLSPKELYGLDDESFRLRAQALPPREGRLATLVFEGKLFPSRFEIPFDLDNPTHKSLEDLKLRARIEADGAAQARLCGLALENDDLIIDLPEAISFETELWVKDLGLPLSECKTVFGADAARVFSRRLRVIRVYSPVELPQDLELFNSLARKR